MSLSRKKGVLLCPNVWYTFGKMFKIDLDRVRGRIRNCASFWVIGGRMVGRVGREKKLICEISVIFSLERSGCCVEGVVGSEFDLRP